MRSWRLVAGRCPSVRPAIPWGGRVMAIIDSFEAMTSTQFFREAIPVDQAAEEIAKGAGTKYDAKLIEAFKKALPVMKKVRETFSDKLGDLIDLDRECARLGSELDRLLRQVRGQETRGNASVISAMVPLANMFGYVNNLRSMSQGRAQFTMQFDHYAQAPQGVAEEVKAKFA